VIRRRRIRSVGFARPSRRLPVSNGRAHRLARCSRLHSLSKPPVIWASRIPDGDKFTDPTYQKLLRLLDSAALVLRDACAAADYRAVKDVVGVYIGIDWPDFDPPFQWRENIRQLAKEYRRSKEASTIAA
jgi:hypothetical protein